MTIKAVLDTNQPCYGTKAKFITHIFLIKWACDADSLPKIAALFTAINLS